MRSRSSHGAHPTPPSGGGDRVLIDTFYVQALMNRDDVYHARALAIAPRVAAATETVITEAVLTEIGDALSDKDRGAAADFIRACYITPNMTVVPVDTELLARALDRYQSRSDKTWGLTDCVSFVVMEDRGLTLAATGDRHFRQAGFDVLLLSD
jgi:uncharacterized protein